MTVLVLGGAGVDHVAYVPSLPLPSGDSVHVPSVHTRAAQTGDFVALGLHALGVPVTHLDVIGDDVEGQLVRDLHERAGVPFVAVTTPAGTKRSVNLVGPDGRRLSLYDTSRSARVTPFPADLVASLAAGARHAHVCITAPCDAAIPALRAAGLTISTDLHDWDGRNPYHRAYADGADVVFLSAVNLPDPPAAMRSLNARTVVATAGAEGGWALMDGVVRRFPAALPPAPVVDSNGAGDAFVAGFLFGHLNGEPVERCLEFGAVAGAHACTVPATEVNPITRDALRVSGQGVEE
ncbi:adenosine kinase [Actinoplanes sp. LDG1-06]|uniref:Adenosine kinase n=1 Tax=Paractinoplanes ovalisporus TaxID=2810368 RepID=A0ABS2AH17_9ACTN|nr:PfkB family carbohydrate kinase [Actinoplanes ovalisporus]MBM2619122.1 adenosine kinase [Actinoplanes ovalisporus]